VNTLHKPKIFGIGLSRTGTTSLHHLLESLGYSSRHFVDALVADKNAEINEDAVMDSPVPMLYQHLDKRYPGSKFILTTRSKEKWLDSMNWLFTHGKVIWNWPRSTQDYHRKFYHTIRYDKKILGNHYDVFHAEVNDYFKDRPNDLLILNLDKGIDVEKVCLFLGIPVKQIVFPKTNERRYASRMDRIKYSIARIFDPH
jgi:hypothetical protein